MWVKRFFTFVFQNKQIGNCTWFRPISRYTSTDTTEAKLVHTVASFTPSTTHDTHTALTCQFHGPACVPWIFPHTAAWPLWLESFTSLSNLGVFAACSLWLERAERSGTPGESGRPVLRVFPGSSHHREWHSHPLFRRVISLVCSIFKSTHLLCLERIHRKERGRGAGLPAASGLLRRHSPVPQRTCFLYRSLNLLLYLLQFLHLYFSYWSIFICAKITPL